MLKENGSSVEGSRLSRTADAQPTIVDPITSTLSPTNCPAPSAAVQKSAYRLAVRWSKMGYVEPRYNVAFHSHAYSNPEEEDQRTLLR